MGDIKNVLVAISVAGFFVAIFIIALVDGGNKYNSDFDEVSLETYNKLESINNLSNDIREDTNTTQQSSVVDILGDFFKAGYKSLSLTKQSIDVVQDMSRQGVEDAELGSGGEQLNLLIGTLILLVIILAIVGVLVGRDL